MYWNGAGIGMEQRMQEAGIRADLHWGPTACFAVAIGLTTPTPRDVPVAMVPCRPQAASIWAFDVRGGHRLAHYSRQTIRRDERYKFQKGVGSEY